MSERLEDTSRPTYEQAIDRDNLSYSEVRKRLLLQPLAPELKSSQEEEGGVTIGMCSQLNTIASRLRRFAQEYSLLKA